MNWIWYILLGALSGWLTMRLLKRESSSFLRNLILGAAGGFVGSWIFKIVGLGATGKLGFIITSVVGAVVVVWVADKLRDTDVKK
ncbi:MAG: GlsB/YeaQ/YmgE family stress response membrane protein [Bacteroidia bacterium]|nr:GlsB/YeaQ/YmgE family stress response membrane protein [Bacteroidia bacterium]